MITCIGDEQLVEEARQRAGACSSSFPRSASSSPPARPCSASTARRLRCDEDRLHDALICQLEPTLDEDVAYGVRLLVDIAERSLADSPFQDPTTAVQAIDRLHDILRQLARRPFPDGRHLDDGGTGPAHRPDMSWEAYVDLAFDEIRLAGAGSPQVARRHDRGPRRSQVDRSSLNER